MANGRRVCINSAGPLQSLVAAEGRGHRRRRNGHSERGTASTNCKRTLTRKQKQRSLPVKSELKVCTPRPNLLFFLLCYVSSRNHVAASQTHCK